MHTQARLPEFSDILEASQRLENRAVRTPLVRSDVLDELTGGRIFFKPECLQRTGSFKFRGAWNYISRLSREANAGGVVASTHWLLVIDPLEISYCATSDLFM